MTDLSVGECHPHLWLSLVWSFLLDGEKTHHVDVHEVLWLAGRVQVGTRKGTRKRYSLAFLVADVDVVCLDTKNHSLQSPRGGGEGFL